MTGSAHSQLVWAASPVSPTAPAAHSATRTQQDNVYPGLQSIWMRVAIPTRIAERSQYIVAALRVLAAVAILGAVALPVMGSARFGGFLQWWSDQPVWFLRVWLLLAFAFGVFTLWSSMAGLRTA